MKDKIIITNKMLKRQLENNSDCLFKFYYIKMCIDIFNFVNTRLYYFVPNILSPASPNPGTIYPLSFNFSSIHAV